MDRFPSSIIKSMRGSGAMTTCVPVRLDQSDWQSAVFFELGGVECKQDRNILSQSNQTFPISLEADLIESATASVVMLRFEIMTNGDNPLAGEVLVVPGMGSVQFDTMKNLTEQQSLGFFLAMEDTISFILSSYYCKTEKDRATKKFSNKRLAMMRLFG